ncbi:MAG: hydroxymethylglutaryl-CoA lyase [Rubricoccaceae bacterium]
MPSPFPSHATLVEVGPRDGFQAESQAIPTEIKVEAITALMNAGLRDIQIASFVHPKWVPQMADAEAVCAAVPRRAGVIFTGLALNVRGVERAAAAAVDAVDVSISTNDTHSQRNAGMDVDGARSSMREMIRLGKEVGLEVRAGLQCVWGCGADGSTSPARVAEMAAEILDAGADQLSLADSTGQANPVTLARMLDAVMPLASAANVPVVLHLHDTRGAGLANVVEGLRHGVMHFDTALGGMGGCPFIAGATGNIPTEDTAAMLEGMGVSTGIDVAAVAAVSRQLEAVLGHGFSGRTYALLADPVSA